MYLAPSWYLTVLHVLKWSKCPVLKTVLFLNYTDGLQSVEINFKWPRSPSAFTGSFCMAMWANWVVIPCPACRLDA